jgi:hypothetical protein
MAFLFSETKFRRPEGDELQRQYTLAGLRKNQGLGKEDLKSNQVGHSADVTQPPLQTPQNSSSLSISRWRPTNPFRQLLHLDTKA